MLYKPVDEHEGRTVEIAFFQVNDSMTGVDAAPRSSTGEEFSLMLSSLMPQNGQAGFFTADISSGAGGEGGLNRSLIDGANAQATAVMASLTDIRQARASAATDAEFFALDAMPASTSSAPSVTDIAGSIDITGLTGAEGLEEASEAQTTGLETLDTAPLAGADLLAGQDETAVDASVDAGSAELDESADSADLSIAFSGGFEDNDNEQGANAESGADSAFPELTLNKTDGALSATPFARHLESASVETLSGAAKSAPFSPQVMDTVEAGIRLSADARGGEVRMKLNPESLGEVRIRLDVSSGVVRAEITVESHEVKSMIEADSDFLKDSLGSHGLTLDKCVVDVAKPFDLKARHEGFRQEASGEERAPGRNNRENGGNSHGRFNQDSERGEERGVDFFI